MFLFLILGLQFTAVTVLSITVRDGDEVTLSCEDVMTDQDKYDRTDWAFSGPRNPLPVELIKCGKIGENAKFKSGRLSVTVDCSLVIKKVTVEDIGRYLCRQYDRSGQLQPGRLAVALSVVSMTEHKDSDGVKLNCSVSTYGRCRHTVKWLCKGRDWDINTREVQTSQSTCLATMSLLTSHFVYTSNYEFLQCDVTDLRKREVQLYNFSSQLSGNDATKPPMTQTTEVMKPSTLNTTEQTACADCSALIYTMLVMRVVEFVLITVVTVLITVVTVRHFRAGAGNQRPPDDHTVSYSARSRAARRSGPAASQEMNDEDDGAVNYEN